MNLLDVTRRITSTNQTSIKERKKQRKNGESRGRERRKLWYPFTQNFEKDNASPCPQWRLSRAHSHLWDPSCPPND